MNTVKEKVVEAAQASVEKTQEVLNEYVIPAAQAGAEKTKEVFDQYVVPTAQAGIDKTQEIIKDYVAPTAQAGKSNSFQLFVMNKTENCLFFLFQVLKLSKYVEKICVEMTQNKD